MKIKSITRNVLFFLSLLTIFLIFQPSNSCYASNEEGFYIENMEVEVVANSDRSYDITETIDVYFTEKRHGITREIPTQSTLEKEIRLENVSVDDVPYENDGDGNIKIGDSDKLVKGHQQYVIHYTLWHYADTEKDADYLYLNLIGTEWDVPIKHFSASIQFPDDVVISDYTITSGSKGSRVDNKTASVIETNEDGTSIIKVVGYRELEANEGVTINVVMPEGSFSTAEQWHPSLIFHNITSNLCMDDYGVLIETRQYDVTVKKESNLRIDFNDYMDDCDSKIKEVLVTLPSGEIRNETNFDYLRIPLADYIGQRVQVTVQIRTAFKVKFGSSGHTIIHFDLYPFYSDYEVEHITATYQMPYTVTKQYVSDTKNYVFMNNLFPADSYSLTCGSSTGTLNMDTKDKNLITVCFNLIMPKTNFVHNSSYFDYVIILVSLFFVLLILWISRKNTLPLHPVPVFYPPDDMNPAELGYVFHEHLNSKDVTSLLGYWASKGLLSIQFEEDKTFKLTKLKNMNGEFQPYERTLFDRIFSFGENDCVTSKDLRMNINQDIEKARKSIVAEFTSTKSLVVPASRKLKKLLSYLLPGCLLFLVILADQKRGFGFSESIVMSIFILLGCKFLTYMGSNLKKKIDLSQNIWSNCFFILVFVTVLFTIYDFNVCQIILGKWASLISFLSIISIALILPWTLRRTPYGNQLLEKTIGFHMFLQSAEKDKLKMLMDEDSSYYYNLQPFAQVLGVSKQWYHQFDDLTLDSPYWLNYQDDCMRDSYYYDMFYMGNTMTSSPSSSSSFGSDSFSGGGDCGGGSGGGGGSSW